MSLLAFLAGIVGLVLVYVMLLRPILRRWSFLAEFWKSIDAAELGWFGKLRVLFDGIKIKLLARLVWVPALIVKVYDGFTQYCASCDLTPLHNLLPAWSQDYLPLVAVLVVPALIDVARAYSGSPVTPDDHVAPVAPLDPIKPAA